MKMERHNPRRAVALLGNVNFDFVRRPIVPIVSMVIILTMQEDHHISVLLSIARVAGR
jgi:hypothetical protein